MTIFGRSGSMFVGWMASTQFDGVFQMFAVPSVGTGIDSISKPKLLPDTVFGWTEAVSIHLGSNLIF